MRLQLYKLVQFHHYVLRKQLLKQLHQDVLPGSYHPQLLVYYLLTILSFIFSSSRYDRLIQVFFFNIFEKTLAQKNSTGQKTQGFFSPKLNVPVVIVVKWISKLSLFLVFLL